MVKIKNQFIHSVNKRRGYLGYLSNSESSGITETSSCSVERERNSWEENNSK